MPESPWASLLAGPRHASRGRADESDDRVVTRATPSAQDVLPGPVRPRTPTCLAALAPVSPRPPGHARPAPGSRPAGRHQSVVPAAAPATPRSKPPDHMRPHTRHQ